MAMDRVALASAPAGERVDASPETAFANAPAVYVETRRRMSMNGWATLHRLLAAGAAALHHLRRPADGRGGLVQLLQLERLWPSRKVHRPQELRLLVRQSGLHPGADQQRPHHRRLASRAIAARARRRAADRRAHDGRGVVPDGLLPALHPRGRRGGPHLALHARRADRPSRHRHEPLRAPAVLPAREHGLGLLAPC